MAPAAQRQGTFAVTRVLASLVLFYQRFVSPLLPPSCRYWPSCSHYALEALHKHGAFTGSVLTVRRLCRCHPWGGHGFDPVPDPVSSPKDTL